jgi:5-methylcytosine-specific restriction protein A
MANVYRWQAPGNGKIFDKPLGERSYMNSRTISVLKFIAKKVKVSQAVFELEIKAYLEANTEYEENDSTPAHFFRPLLFLGFLKISSSRVLELTLEGDKFLHFYEKEDFAKCKKYILNQLDNSKYPSVATKDIKLQLFPFRILFKLLLSERENGLSSKFIKEQLVYLKYYDDIVLYEKSKDLEKIAKDKEYDKFYTWVVNSLVNIEILQKRGGNYFIADDIYSNVEELYKNLSYKSLFFSDETLLCQLDTQTAHERYKRDARLIQEAKSRDSFTCQVDKTHTTFVSKGVNYVEGHHVVPMFQQKNYTFNLDDVDNILSLCPTCHREIHSSDEKSEILSKIYKIQVAFMSANSITFDDLNKMYYCV